MAITNGTLATKINVLIQQWEDMQVELQAWMNGVVGGGPNLDGQYPITDYQAVIGLFTCPAQLQDDVDSAVTGAQGYSISSAASAAAALISETAAALSETAASVSEDGARFPEHCWS